MISLIGKLYNIASVSKTDSATGEVSATHTADVLHTVRGKTELASVKIELGVLEGWQKCIGKDVSIGVRFYAMKNREGGIQSGLTLDDKASFPVIQRMASA